LLAASGLAAAALVVPGPAYAADDTPCSEYTADDRAQATDNPSLPLALLGVGEAFELFDRARKGVPGAGIGVAVIDNGVSRATGLLDVQDGTAESQAPLVDYHGTAVAGLIAGRPREADKPVGIAPGATIFDVRVYDASEPTESGQKAVETAGVVRGLRWVADNARRTDPPIKVANVSLDVERTRALDRAVRAAQRQDVVVVAASGNRAMSETSPDYEEFHEYQPPEDAYDAVYPAGYDDVLAVSATAAGLPGATGSESLARTYVLQNSAVDVAVPTYNAVTFAINGGSCMLNGDPPVATSWAAAEVSGIVAMLRSWYRDETAEQIIARITTTADGTAGEPSLLTGAGVVQPLEALGRPLRVEPDGTVDAAAHEESRVPPAVAPPPVEDPMAEMRHEAVWWGLFCGGAVVLALVLRPVLARRRRTG
jgi:membrane-anchored mycosin MYCP